MKRRVEAGAPNPDFTLAIGRDGDGVQLTFASHTNGMSRSVAGATQGGGIACALPNADLADGVSFSAIDGVSSSAPGTL